MLPLDGHGSCLCRGVQTPKSPTLSRERGEKNGRASALLGRGIIVSTAVNGGIITTIWAR